MKHLYLLAIGVCLFKNPYSFPYKTNVETSEAAPTVEEACDQVLTCLNNVMCIRYGEPGPKFGWVLDSWEEN